MAATQLGLNAACLYLLGPKTATLSPSDVWVLPQIILDLLLTLEGQLMSNFCVWLLQTHSWRCDPVREV